MFAVELMIDLYGSGFRRFVKSGRNLFDAFIVLVSLIIIIAPNTPGFNVLPPFRASRADAGPVLRRQRRNY